MNKRGRSLIVAGIVLSIAVFLTLSFILAYNPMINAANYENNDKTAVLGDSKVNILTPLTGNKVEVGDDVIVMIIEGINFPDKYISSLGEIEIKNMKKNKKEDKPMQWKYAVYEDVKINDYGEICKEEYNEKNKTTDKICKIGIIGSHIEKRITEWRPLSRTDYPTDKIVLGLATEVKEGDHYDAIPTIMNYKLSRWAEWEAMTKDGIEISMSANSDPAYAAPDAYAWTGMWVQTIRGTTQIIGFNISVLSTQTHCYAWDTISNMIYEGILNNYNCSFNPAPIFANETLILLYTNHSTGGNSYYGGNYGGFSRFSGGNIEWIGTTIFNPQNQHEENYSTSALEIENVWTRIGTGNVTSVPVTSKPVIKPHKPKKHDALKCNATLTDGIYTNLTAYWSWYKEGVLFSSGLTNVSNGISSNVANLSSGTTLNGENWTCGVMPYNNYNFGEADYDSELVSWAIIFNVTNWEDGQSITKVDISCNDSFSVLSKKPPYLTNFTTGMYECNFTETSFYDKEIIFTADSNKTIDIRMSLMNQLTIQEHTWLEWLYNCFNSGTCKELLENINRTTSQIWQDMTKTDMAVVTQEDILSSSLSPEQNISIAYTVNIPYKEGIASGELLPIRLYFWFTDGGTNCYNQDKTSDSNRAESPYCLPLIAEILGPNNGSISFQVDLKPALESGDYSIIRSIEIDPNEVWTQYGREQIGTIKVLEDTNKAEINLIEKSRSLAQNSGMTGAVLGAVQGLLSGWQIVAIGSIIGLILVTFIISKTILKLKKYDSVSRTRILK